jgi:hypothetical protein
MNPLLRKGRCEKLFLSRRGWNKSVEGSDITQTAGDEILYLPELVG